jgi:hypothetical protein
MNTTVGLSVRGVIGALVGGAVGFIVFVWLARQGLYALVLPGAMVGLGCAVLLQRSSNLAGILCGLAAVPLCLFCQWKILPFRDDPSLAYFVTHLHELDRPTVTWIMVGISAAFAYWLGKGRDGTPLA